MKATLEFNLPEDQTDFDLCNDALNMSCALDDIRNYLRSQYKYGDPPDDIEKIYEQFFEITNNYNIEL